MVVLDPKEAEYKSYKVRWKVLHNENEYSKLSIVPEEPIIYKDSFTRTNQEYWITYGHKIYDGIDTKLAQYIVDLHNKSLEL